MAKTEQVRVPADLIANCRAIASTLDLSLPEYVEKVLRKAVAKDLPRAIKHLTKQAEQAGKEGEAEAE